MPNFKTIAIGLIISAWITPAMAQNQAEVWAVMLKSMHNDSVRNFNLADKQIQRNYELKMQAPPRQQPNWQKNPYQPFINQQQNR